MTCSGLHEKSKRNSLLKGMGDEIRIGLLHVTPRKHPLLKENRKNPFRPCARVHRFKLSKVDSDTPLSAPGPCALDHVLISLKKGPVCYDIVECRSLETHQV